MENKPCVFLYFTIGSSLNFKRYGGKELMVGITLVRDWTLGRLCFSKEKNMFIGED